MEKRFEGPESKRSPEKEKLPPLFFVYRDNSLFNKHMEIVLKTLGAMGRDVEIQKFPKGTPSGEIGDWLSQNLDQLKGNSLAYDITTERALEKGGFKRMAGVYDRNKFPEDPRIIDGIFFDSARRMILGADYQKSLKSESAENYRMLLAKLVELASKDHMPKSVSLVTNQLEDHPPMEVHVEDDKEATQQKTKELIRAALKDAGIPENVISESSFAGDVLPDNLPDNLRDSLDKEGNWVIYDRHLENACGKQGVFLSLPPENFLDDALAQGLIDVPQELYEQELAEAAKEKFQVSDE